MPKRLKRPRSGLYPTYEGCGGALGPQEDIKTTLFVAAMNLEENLEVGAKCPCCLQYAKVYRRSLNSGMAASLIWLCREFMYGAGLEAGAYVDIGRAPKYVLRSREWGKLAHWKLAEIRPHLSDEKRTSGLWRPTKEGGLFVRGTLEVPSHVYLYDNKVLGFSRDRVGIVDALKNKFDYKELMGPLL